MRKFTFIILTIILIGCKPSPTYNAFDEQFDISIREVIKNGCDTIYAGCGWINLQEKKGRLRAFYQVFDNDMDNVLAKGFTYYVDTFYLKPIEEYTYNSKPIDSFNRKEIDFKILNLELKKFNYRFLEQNSDTIGIIRMDLKDTIRLNLTTSFVGETDSIFVRQFEYWKEK